jgi:hypothetical protein
MEAAKQISQNVSENLTQNVASVGDVAKDLVSSKPGGVFNKFRDNKFVDGAKGFLDSNSMVAKVVFILLVLIVFIMLLRIMAQVLHTLFSPSPTPVLINGLITGKKALVISQDPKIPGSKIILKSDNEEGGIEFTYSCWLMIGEDNFHSFKPGEVKHIFHKGNNGFNSQGFASVNNSPGLYIDGNENKLIVKMTTFKESDGSVANTNEIVVPDIPVEKWINVIIRVENRFLDVYINGSIVARHELESVPKQNDSPVYVNQNQGFSGNLSALRYYNYAITTTEIQKLVTGGPNMSSNDTLSIFPPYLSMRWFLGNLGE